MFRSIEKIFYHILDSVLPKRDNFSIVQKLDEDSINNLPKAPEVEGFDWVHPLFHYKDRRVKAIIWELKYRENTKPLGIIGRLLFEEILALVSDISLFRTDSEFLLIPIPISSLRRSERGYNQSEYIAKAVLENDENHILLYTPQWFQKINDTPTQNKSESKEERMKNLIGCFGADPRIEGKIIILIDDVVTTGSTLSEARKILLEAGARDVFAFTIAH